LKKRIAIWLAMVLFHGITLSQTQLTENVEFSTQNQIDDFQLLYPDCTHLAGNVSINGHLIDNLDGLAGITSIGGDLVIGSRFSAINFYCDLNGLNNLVTIGGNLEILNNGSLNRLTGLERLSVVKGNLVIENNIALHNLLALGNLSQVGGDILISRNPLLQDLKGLEGLTEVNGDMLINLNPELQSLEGLVNINRIDGDLDILFNETLARLTGLESLAFIGDTLKISGNPALQDLTGLDHLEFIEGGLCIGGPAGGNSSLKSLQGLEGLISLKEFLMVENNDSLKTLSGLESIAPESIWDLHIANNPMLSSCEARGIAKYLSHPSGKVDIVRNAEGCNNPSEVAEKGGFNMPCLPFGNYYFHCQADIDEFPGVYPDCNILSGDIIISGDDISDLDGLGHVTTINGNLIILNNDKLGSLAGLRNLQCISQGLFIGDNDLLTDLTGLNHLGYIGELLEVDFNGELQSLDGLEALTHVGKIIHVEGNGSLVSLAGLENVDASQLEMFIIANNFSLADCDLPNICDCVLGLESNITVFNNAIGCKTPVEVESSCTLATEQPVYLTDQCSYYPDPSNGEVTFSFRLQEPMNVNLIIYDRSGREVATVVDRVMSPGNHRITWDAGELSRGIYFYSLTAGSVAASGELVVSL
jgi:hypothetical protein